MDTQAIKNSISWGFLRYQRIACINLSGKMSLGNLEELNGQKSLKLIIHDIISNCDWCYSLVFDFEITR